MIDKSELGKLKDTKGKIASTIKKPPRRLKVTGGLLPNERASWVKMGLSRRE